MSKVYYLELNERSARRLNGLLKSNIDPLFIVNKGKCYFVTEDTISIKIVEFSQPNAENFSCKINASVFAGKVRPTGVIVMMESEGTLTIGYAQSLEQAHADDFELVCNSSYNSLPFGTTRTYLNLINASKSTEMEISSWGNLKSLIAACAVAEEQLLISGGLAVTYSQSVKIYHEMADKDISIGLNAAGLKEIDKFGVQENRKVYTYQNYIILNSGMYYLAIRKANIGVGEEEIPSMYREDVSSQFTFTLNIANLINWLSTMPSSDFKDITDSLFEISLDAETIFIHLKQRDHLLSASITNVKTWQLADTSIPSTIRCRLADIIKLQKLLTGKDQSASPLLNITIYPNNIRMALADGNNALIRRLSVDGC